MHCAAPIAENPDGPGQEGRFCILCGRLLPDGSTSDVCEHCLHGEAPSPDAVVQLGEIPLPPEPDEPSASKRRPKWLLPVIVSAALLLGGGGAFALWSMRQEEREPEPPAAVEPSPAEQYAAACAQEMVRDAAYDPASVHFSKSTLEVEEEDGVYTVRQQFSRRVATGETVEADYLAELTLHEPLQSGYDALRLQVGDAVLYDYTGD